jgi:hypothetical protein
VSSRSPPMPYTICSSNGPLRSPLLKASIRIMAQRAPDGAPGSQPQRGPAAAGVTGLAGVVAAGVLTWRQARVLDHRADGGKPGRVACLSQDRRDLQRRHPRDRPGHLQHSHRLQGLQHPGVDLGQLAADRSPVAQRREGALERSRPLGDHLGGVGQRRVGRGDEVTLTVRADRAPSRSGRRDAWTVLILKLIVRVAVWVAVQHRAVVSRADRSRALSQSEPIRTGTTRAAM